MERCEQHHPAPTIPRWLAPAAVLGLGVAEAARRLAARGLPTDLSAYVSAAQTFAARQDPYGRAIYDAPAWQGFPFVYCPAALWLLLPLALLPRAALLLGDLALRGCAAWWVAAQLRRRSALPRATVWELLLLAWLYEPFVTDLMAGNLALYMLAALLAVLRLGEAARAPTQLAGGVGLGVAFGFKPMWGVAAGYAALQQRRWWVAAGLLAGAGSMLLISLAQGPLFGSWLRHLDEVRAAYRTCDALAISPVWLAIVALAWGVVAAWLLRPSCAGAAGAARGELTWLWGCASLIAWPRLAPYCYLALAPVLVAVAPALGRGPALLIAAPWLGPLPWLLGERWMPRVRYGWALALAVGLAAWLARLRKGKPSGRGCAAA
jgi:hypothetical protein